MNRIGIAFGVLLSHWRRRPGQLATLMLGLSLATGLWTGVQAINAEARSSYAAAENTLSPQGLSSIERADGSALAVADFVTLQRAGWRTSPVLEGRKRFGIVTVRLVGIEPLTTPLNFSPEFAPAEEARNEGSGDLLDFLGSSGAAFVNPETAARLADAEGLPDLVENASVAPGTMVVDIANAERLLDRTGEIDRLVVTGKAVNTGDTLPSGFALIQADEATSDVARLTDSFHLNLTAFGLLSFAVGLFIVHGTIGLAFEQRRGMFRTMRTLGLSAQRLAIALTMELLAFALVAGALGVALGYLIAAFLLPDVAATLDGLYGAQVAGTLSFRAEWWATGLAIAVLGTLAAAAGSLYRVLRLPVLASVQPRAWALQSARTVRVQAGVALVMLVVAALALAFGSGLVMGFIVLGLVLVGCALLLPVLFGVVLRFGEGLARGPLSQWFWADTRQQVPGLSLALMALLLALAANIGVSTMVGSFRGTFTGWLDQRLAAELYLRFDDDKQREEVLGWLTPQVDAVLPVWSVKADLAGAPGEIFGMADHATYRDAWPLLSGGAEVWDRLAAGDGLLVNEQLSRREGLAIGDAFDLPKRDGLPIVGVYSDYGNPSPQVIVNTAVLEAMYPALDRLSFVARLPDSEVAAMIEDLRERFALGETQLVDQKSIKSFSLAIFDRTFTVTDALNVLTLSVAGFAIFTSLLTLATMRLPQLAPVWALGLTRRRLAWLELLRALLLAVMTAVAALPVGLALAWLLLAVVNVEAFGWKLPMQLFPGDWVRLGGFALIAAVLAAAIPAFRLARTSPADLVKVFANER